jgi:LmbE family N-acetylglucosaminyl deacetylase
LNVIPCGELNSKISAVVDKIKPDIIYTHYEHDLNYDHTLIFRACMVASRPPKKIKLVSFETLSETEWNNSVFQPNLWIDIGDLLSKKIEAFKIYKSEVKQYPHPRSAEGIKILAQKRGNEIITEYAEAFIVLKDYW